MKKNHPHIFLLTDFGTSDHYVAVMKAVILSRCPLANFIDISHDVPPQGIEAGAYLLESTWPWLPQGSTVVAVIDPGVGTSREAAVFCHDKVIIGPNNGLMGFLPSVAEGRRLDKPEFWMEQVSETFHGRDIFAPCAGYVASGGHWSDLGNAPAKPVQMLQPVASANDNKTFGRIIYFDHFGNAITSLRATDITAADRLSLEMPGRFRCPVSSTFSDANEGAVVAYIGSTNRLEIAVRNGNARIQLDLNTDDKVYLEAGAV